MKRKRKARHPTSIFPASVELLENRRLLTVATFPLTSTNPFLQTWSPVSQISVNDDWSGVQSIVGYRGDNLSSSTPLNPQSILADTSPTAGSNPVDVNANQTNPNGFTTGGVTEFEITNPTIALAGSNTANAPNLVIYLDTTAVSNVRIRYTLRDLETGADNAVQPIALQYRFGSTGNFINVPTAYIADATTGPNTAGPDTPVDVTLTNLGGRSNVQLRVISVDAGGADEWVGVDDINITGTPAAPAPGTLGFNPSTYTVAEGVGTFNVTVKRTGGTLGAVSATYTLVSGTAISGTDFTAASGVVNFADGIDTATIPVTITQDNLVEASESFTLTLTSPGGGASVDGVAATVTITDDDFAGQLAFNPATATVAENAGTVALTVTRTNGTSGAVSASFTTVAGTALATSDFVAQSGTLNFADGQASATITITIVDDSIAENLESFTVTLSNPAGGASLGSATTATVNITDNDGVVPTGLLINEVFVDPPNVDAPMQFVEIKGTPGTSLNNVYLISLEGDLPDNAGNVDGSINLSGATIGSNGLLLVEATDPRAFTPGEPNTAVFKTTFFDESSIYFLERGSTTLLLVYRNPSGAAAPVEGDDLDADNTSTGNVGTLDALPSNISILDGYGALDGGSTDIVYVPTPLVSRGGAADAVVRFNGNNSALSAAAFYYGILRDNDGLGTGNSTLTFSNSATERSTNFPVSATGTPIGIVTPGAANAGTVADTTPPTVVSTTFDPRQGQKVVVTFSEDVRNTTNGLTASDFTLTNTTTSTSVSLVVSSVSSDGKTVTLSFANTGGATNSVLLDGNYSLMVLAGQVADLAGNTLVADATSTFKFLNADFNVSGSVDFADLLTVAQNFGTQSGATFATGDANYDGKVDFSDLLLLAQKFGTSAPAILAAFGYVTPAAPPAPTRIRPRADSISTKKDGGLRQATAIEPAAIAPTRKGTFASSKQIA